MNIVDNPKFEDMPYRIETNNMDQVIMTPHAMNHSDYKTTIIMHLLKIVRYGRVSVECAVQTVENLKTIDVTWRTRIVNEKICSFIPELCIEVKSPSNTMREMHHKRDLCLNHGGIEFWLCIEGKMIFFGKKGTMNSKIEKSVLFPSFPKYIKI